MANYTIEIRTLFQDPSFELFDFKYDFYSDDKYAKELFEQKFIQHYLFHEIGFETVYRFKENLKDQLRLNMPYYRKLYETELKSKDIEFLLNKDYKETYTKNYSKKETEKNNSTLEVKKDDDTSVIVSDTYKDNSKESNLENGISDVDLNGSLTNQSASDGFKTQVNTGNNISNINNTGNYNTDKTNDENESYTLIGKGNIGTTSSGSLLEDWRKVLQDMDTIIINDCQNLFLKVY